MDRDLLLPGVAGLAEEVECLRTLTARLQAENARLLRLLELTPKEAAAPGPVQMRFFDTPPGPIDRQSPPEVKVDFFGELFAARSDIYAVGGRTRVPAELVGCRPYVANGAKACATKTGTTCH